MNNESMPADPKMLDKEAQDNDPHYANNLTKTIDHVTITHPRFGVSEDAKRASKRASKEKELNMGDTPHICPKCGHSAGSAVPSTYADSWNEEK